MRTSGLARSSSFHRAPNPATRLNIKLSHASQTKFPRRIQTRFTICHQKQRNKHISKRRASPNPLAVGPAGQPLVPRGPEGLGFYLEALHGPLDNNLEPPGGLAMHQRGSSSGTKQNQQSQNTEAKVTRIFSSNKLRSLRLGMRRPMLDCVLAKILVRGVFEGESW